MVLDSNSTGDKADIQQLGWREMHILGMLWVHVVAAFLLYQPTEIEQCRDTPSFLGRIVVCQ
jgi:hypothetical protein